MSESIETRMERLRQNVEDARQRNDAKRIAQQKAKAELDAAQACISKKWIEDCAELGNIILPLKNNPPFPFRGFRMRVDHTQTGELLTQITLSADTVNNGTFILQMYASKDGLISINYSDNVEVAALKNRLSVMGATRDTYVALVMDYVEGVQKQIL